MNQKDHKDPRASVRLFLSLREGLLAGLFTSWFLLKVMIPTMAVVQVLKGTGLLDLLSSLFSPLMGVFGLPGESSLVLITGGLINIYAAIAVAVNIPLTAKAMTILAIMVLIAHNLIVETAVQSRAGTPAVIMLPVRLSAAVLSGLLFSRIIPGGGEAVIRGAPLKTEAGWGSVLLANGVSLLKIVLIILSLMATVEIIREFGILDRFTAALSTPMKALGMDRRTSLVAAVGLVLGLAYGAGLIIDETRRSGITRKEILATNIFLGTNHALFEDSLIFAAVGANLLWIVLGRLVFGSLYLRTVLPVILYFWRPGETAR